MATRAERARRGDAVFSALTGTFALAVVASFAFVLLLLGQRALPAVRAFGPGFLWSQEWVPDQQRFGALAYVYGTVASSLIALAVAVPVSVGTALALVTLLPRRLADSLGIVIELLAAVPSIVFGVWGLAVVAPFVAGLSGGQSFGPSLLAAGLVLAVMVLPIITAVTRDLLRAVPAAQTEAALALGATRWEVGWRIVLPHARTGILAAVILGLGRATGETMAVIMVIGNQPLLHFSPFKPAATMASLIANEFGDPSGPLHTAALVEIGLLMLGISLGLNLLARLIVRRLGRRMGGTA
ncbi:MAG: phosphate transport system permease protein [Thermoplasmata archaeon]|jgi:phosphate transport system permease protein|nr:phosphate transport system permease protein [Thermoplasmata archaeon]